MQELLSTYDADGACCVSNDRDFLTAFCRDTIAMEGDGKATCMPAGGDWTDYLHSASR